MEDRGKKACSHHLAGSDDTVSMVISHHSFCMKHAMFFLIDTSQGHPSQ